MHVSWKDFLQREYSENWNKIASKVYVGLLQTTNSSYSRKKFCFNNVIKESHNLDGKRQSPKKIRHFRKHPQNLTSVFHVPCTLGFLVTCLVFSFMTFLPSAFLSLVACKCISSTSKFLTHTTRWLLFSVKAMKYGKFHVQTLLNYNCKKLREGERITVEGLQVWMLPTNEFTNYF